MLDAGYLIHLDHVLSSHQTHFFTDLSDNEPAEQMNKNQVVGCGVLAPAWCIRAKTNRAAHDYHTLQLWQPFQIQIHTEIQIPLKLQLPHITVN